MDVVMPGVNGFQATRQIARGATTKHIPVVIVSTKDQATDRAYHIGQTKKVFVYRFITKGTVEEKIQKLKMRKRSLVDSVISVDRNIGKSITFDDLQDIFSWN